MALKPQYISTAGLNQADVLRALYDYAHPQPGSWGFLSFRDGHLGAQEAKELISTTKGKRFDYLHGRPMKIDLSDPSQFWSGGFNRDNGPLAAHNAIENLRGPTKKGGK